MKKKQTPPVVLFNASVVLAGLKSPSGGSAKLLSWCRKGKITGVISEIILDEIFRNTPKIGLEKEAVELWVKAVFSRIEKAPKKEIVDLYRKIVIDEGDAHLLASCDKVKAKFLATLDKKHLLALQKKIRWVKIVSPGELIEIFSE